MKCEKKKGWYCELFNSKCDGPNDCCADFIQADDVSDSALMAGSVSREMLERAMRVAVDKGVFPKFGSQDAYLKNWERMKACLEAAFRG